MSRIRGRKVGEQGQGSSAGAPRGDRAATGLGAAGAAGQVDSRWGSVHRHWGTAHAPTHHAVSGGAGPPGGGAGSPACGCCNAPPDPTAAGQDAGSALTPVPHAAAATPAPRPPQLAAGRADTHMAGHKRGTRGTELRTNSPPRPPDPALIAGGPRPQSQQPIKSCSAPPRVPPQPISVPRPTETAVILAPPPDRHGRSPAPPQGCPMGAAPCAPPPHGPAPAEVPRFPGCPALPPPHRAGGSHGSAPNPRPRQPRAAPPRSV